jgi:HAD superfamily hydrolase (TIGR01509 family)
MKTDMPIDAIIFDCDGTLVDSVPLATEVLVEYLASLGVTLSVHEAGVRFGSGRLAESVAELERSIGFELPGEFVPELRRRRDRAVRERLRPIDGALELGGGLRIPLAVASNGPLAQTLLSLEVTGLLGYFSPNVFSAYDLGRWKPDPELFLHAARTLGVEPSRCAVVEDAAPGIDAGIAAGMTVFTLCDEERGSCGRVLKIHDLAEIRQHLIRPP